jgi:hypothetical protein
MGGVPARPNLSIHNLDESIPLRGALNHIVAEAGHAPTHKIDALFILCHGYAGENTRMGVCADAGGMGLQLGRDGVTQSNVGQWVRIRSKVDNIIVYACAAADRQPGNEYTRADGRYLMGALAVSTNADVYAADKIQWYWTFKGLRNGAFDFGAWDGQLYKFDRTLGQASAVASAPFDLAKVLAGKEH